MNRLGKLLSGLLPSSAKSAALRYRQEQELRGMGSRELSDLAIGASEIPFLLHGAQGVAVQKHDVATGNAQCCGSTEKSFKSLLVLQQ